MNDAVVLEPTELLKEEDLSPENSNDNEVVIVSSTSGLGSNSIFRGRGAKRRTVDSVVLSQASVAKKSRGDSLVPKMVVGHGYPVDHPYNKDGYRYILAEPDPNAPYRQEFDESSEWGGKPIPGWLYRVLNPISVLLALHDRAPQLRVSEDRLSVTGEKGYCMIRATHGEPTGWLYRVLNPISVLLALHDRAPQLRVSEDRLSVTGEKGYCMIRATHGVSRGAWYWEAKITDQPEGSHARIGFSQAYGNLQGPLGYDRYGYSWRSRMGTKFHQAIGKTYCKGGYGHGDVLGFLIIMPDTNPKAPLIPPSYKDRPLVRFKSHLYYEDKDDKSQEADVTLRPESKIICFKNGKYQGVAYENIFEGVYYPAVSLYKGCTVNVNFGPDFWTEPGQVDFPHRGMFERAEQAIVEQTTSDLHFLTENHGKLRLENAVILPQ
ncbi:unnamed protein product [Allacma fusca]|uniref:B30.2/SPRY domain-containing protein n=1 Tax=Allacma fusca TaxID=39272 RepID=A0A8J2MDX0_9HEXA|nr:unnamed protein product [Allacma fusca]